MNNTDAEVAAVASRRACPPGFVMVPETVLPSGARVPAFAVARWLAARGRHGAVLLSDTAPPWVNVSYHAARRACAASGMGLLTELQALAIAHDLARQAANWSGGAVGAGELVRGLRLDTFGAAQPACVRSPDARERRWHVLSNGERIVDAAGNAFSWVFDDVQGNADGVVAQCFAADSPTVSGMPGARWERGLGWWPRAGRSWWGRALARGGAWSSREGAGAFTVIDEKPGTERPYIGFRCTWPL
jgi:hypothetical protein